MQSIPRWLNMALLFTEGDLLTPTVQAELASTPAFGLVILARADASYETLRKASLGVSVDNSCWDHIVGRAGLYRTAEQEANLLEVMSRANSAQRDAIRSTCYTGDRTSRQDAFGALVGRKLTKAQRRILLADATPQDFVQHPELTEWFLELNPVKWLGEYTTRHTPVQHVSDERILQLLTSTSRKMSKQALTISQHVPGYSSVLHAYGADISHHLENRPAVAEQLAQYPAWLPVVANTSHWKDEYLDAVRVWKNPAIKGHPVDMDWYDIVSALAENPVADNAEVIKLIDDFPVHQYEIPSEYITKNLRRKLSVWDARGNRFKFPHYETMSKVKKGSRKGLEVLWDGTFYVSSLIGSEAAAAAEAKFPGVTSRLYQRPQDVTQGRHSNLDSLACRGYKEGVYLVRDMLTALPEERRAEALTLLIDLVSDIPHRSDERVPQAVETVLALLDAEL